MQAKEREQLFSRRAVLLLTEVQAKLKANRPNKKQVAGLLGRAGRAMMHANFQTVGRRLESSARTIKSRPQFKAAAWRKDAEAAASGALRWLEAVARKKAQKPARRTPAQVETRLHRILAPLIDGMPATWFSVGEVHRKLPREHSMTNPKTIRLYLKSRSDIMHNGQKNKGSLWKRSIS